MECSRSFTWGSGAWCLECVESVDIEANVDWFAPARVQPLQHVIYRVDYAVPATNYHFHLPRFNKAENWSERADLWI